MTNTGDMTPIDPILIVEAPQTSQTNSYAISENPFTYPLYSGFVTSGDQSGFQTSFNATRNVDNR